MFKKLWPPKPDLMATDASRLNSPFIDIEKIPADLEALPTKTVPFIWFFLRQIKLTFFTLTILFFISNILTSMLPFFLSQITDVMETGVQGQALWQALKPALWSFVIWMVFVDAGCYHAGRQIWMHVTVSFQALIVRQMCIYTWRHSIDYFQNDFAGRLSNKINDIASSTRQIVRDFLYAFLFAISQFVATIALSATIHWHYLLIVLVYVCIYAGIILFWIPRILRVSMSVQDSKTIITGQVVDTITNIQNVKIFARGRHESSRLTGQLNDFSRKGLYLSSLYNGMYLMFDLNNKVFWLVMFGLLTWNIYSGVDTYSTAILLIPLTIGLSHTVWWFGDMLIMMFEMLGVIKDGIQTLVKPFKIKDDANASSLLVNKGHIAFKGVNFSYTERPVFEGLNINILPGQKIGLIGPSGAGKSTLVQLLLRLHDIQSGVISIDDQDIKSVTQDSLRAHIAVIPQSSDLLHRSIRENIRYGRLDASEEDIIAAAKRAHAHEFILELRDHEGRVGYDAMVGERGVKLSGGQRQRIAIARAVLKDAPVLLLDEATSALDSESERLIQESLQELMVGRTVIAIAHRLSTIAQLDRLLVMEDGQIIEDGSHYELLKKKGLYARLWALQSGGFLPEA